NGARNSTQGRIQTQEVNRNSEGCAWSICLKWAYVIIRRGHRPLYGPLPLLIASGNPIHSFRLPFHSFQTVCKHILTLDQAATAQAQQRDNTATRALTAVPIKTSSGKCLFVDPTTGDFRANLIPVQIKDCDGSAGQQWDVITAGKHNNQPGFALIVSTQARLRETRSSCSLVVDELMETVKPPTRSSSSSLVVSPPAPEFLAPRTATTRNALRPREISSMLPDVTRVLIRSTTTPAPSTTSTRASSTVTPVSRAGGTLNPTAAAEAQQRDNTATRAFTSIQIKTSSGQCLSVDPTAGDFRQNLIPIQTVNCDANSDRQKWDVITAGKHNNKPGFALVVSSLVNGCLNFDDRRAAGDQVILFSCGGRGDGSGGTQGAQLFKFAAGQTTIVLSPETTNNSRCMVQKGGLLDVTACNANSPSADQVFSLGNAGTNVNANNNNVQNTVSTASASRAVVTPAAVSSSTRTSPTVTPVSRAGGTLNPTAAAEAQQRDNTATRALTAVQIKTSSGQCLSVDPTAGDFRQNLIPVQAVNCDANSDRQKWDIITAGKHNNKPGFALVVSTLVNGCVNLDERRAAGQTSIVLSPENTNNSRCLVQKGGLLDVTACNANSPSADQRFTFGNAVNTNTGNNNANNGNNNAVVSTTRAATTSTPAPAATNTATRASATVTPVSRAGGTLNPTAAAEAQQRDNTATRAFTKVQIKVCISPFFILLVLTICRLRVANVFLLTLPPVISAKTSSLSKPSTAMRTATARNGTSLLLASTTTSQDSRSSSAHSSTDVSTSMTVVPPETKSSSSRVVDVVMEVARPTAHSCSSLQRAPETLFSAPRTRTTPTLIRYISPHPSSSQLTIFS
ncbi:369_t:CDS:2, partial [Acaulospora colombiana]